MMTTSKTSIINQTKNFINRKILFKYFLFQHAYHQQLHLRLAHQHYYLQFNFDEAKTLILFQ
jgi:hypothetical protein